MHSEGYFIGPYPPSPIPTKASIAEKRRMVGEKRARGDQKGPGLSARSLSIPRGDTVNIGFQLDFKPAIYAKLSTELRMVALGLPLAPSVRRKRVREIDIARASPSTILNLTNVRVVALRAIDRCGSCRSSPFGRPKNKGPRVGNRPLPSCLGRTVATFRSAAPAPATCASQSGEQYHCPGDGCTEY
jgi:hypothetical protein